MKHIQSYKELSLWTKALFLPTYLIITPYYFRKIPKITRNKIIDSFMTLLLKAGIGAIIDNTDDENGVMRIVAMCYTDVTYELYKVLVIDSPKEYIIQGGDDLFLILRYINNSTGDDMKTNITWRDGKFFLC